MFQSAGQMVKPPDLIGRMVGEYEIRALIGVGGMGAVFEGRHPMIGKRVAVKVLLPGFSDSRELVERFIDEARAVNEIGHRGIVDIFAFGKLPEGSLYFVMEYLIGQPLDQVIRTRSPLGLTEVLAWVGEVADALEAAHSVGIIHRDIKPSNIFLVSAPGGATYLKLLDFGIAKLGSNDDASPKTVEGQALGTPDYMAPEQARGLEITPATDVYALGCVLFELLTSRRVFKGPNAQRLMFMHAEDPPPAPSSLRLDVPAAADELVLWMLEKYPDARPRSAGEVARHCAALRSELAGEPRPPSLPRIPSLSTGWPGGGTSAGAGQSAEDDRLTALARPPCRAQRGAHRRTLAAGEVRSRRARGGQGDSDRPAPAGRRERGAHRHGAGAQPRAGRAAPTPPAAPARHPVSRAGG